jgi:hypothetical protein
LFARLCFLGGCFRFRLVRCNFFVGILGLFLMRKRATALKQVKDTLRDTLLVIVCNSGAELGRKFL